MMGHPSTSGPKRREVVAVFLDVDRVLSPIGRTSEWADYELVRAGGHGHIWRSAEMLGRIGSLAGELAFLTDWGADANGTFAEQIGRGPLPVIANGGKGDFTWWKLNALIRHLGEHPDVEFVIWADDLLNQKDEAGVTYAEQAAELARAFGCGFLPIVPDDGITTSHLRAMETFMG